MVLGNTALQGIVAYGGIQDPELIRMGLTKAELAPKNYIVPVIRLLNMCRHIQHHSQYRPASIVLLPFALAKGSNGYHYTELMAGTEALVTTLGYFQLIKG